MNRVAITAILLLSAACGPGKPSTGSTPAYDRNRLAREELATRPSDNMRVVVSAMRPNWILTPMGASGINNSAATAGVTIVLDGQVLGGVEMLSSISTDTVESARYFSATEAQSKYGLRISSPVIELTTRRPQSP